MVLDFKRPTLAIIMIKDEMEEAFSGDGSAPARENVVGTDRSRALGESEERERVLHKLVNGWTAK